MLDIWNRAYIDKEAKKYLHADMKIRFYYTIYNTTMTQIIIINLISSDKIRF